MTLGRSLHLSESVLPLVKFEIKILAWVSKMSLRSLDKKSCPSSNYYDYYNYFY